MGMNKFIILYKGPRTLPDETHKGWPEWFEALGTSLVSIGSPMTERAVVGSDGVSITSLNGYSIIQAESLNDAKTLVNDHPFLQPNSEYAIEIFEIPKA